MSFKNVNIVTKKVKDSYEIRLATPEETKQDYQASMPSWKTGLSKEQRPARVKGFNDCVMYPPDYEANTVTIQSDKCCMIINFKTLQGKMFIRGMKGYTGGYFNLTTVGMFGKDYDFNKCPEVVQEILKQLPSKGTLVNESDVVSIQF